MKRADATTVAPESLSSYIQARFDEFSRSQKDVAQYIVDHLDEVAFQTAEELARRANTSRSTVVRFSPGARLRGLSRAPARRRARSTAAVTPPARRPTGVGSRRRCSRSTRTSSRRRSPPTTSTSRRPRARSRAARSRRRSTRSSTPRALLIVGTDQMAFFASYLRHLLMLLDLRAEIVASPSQEALGRLGAHRRGDARHRPVAPAAPHPLVVRAMKLARHRKAQTMAITDATLSEVAKLAQHPAVLLVQQPGLRALAHRAAVRDPGARLRRLQPRRRGRTQDRIKAFRLK